MQVVPVQQYDTTMVNTQVDCRRTDTWIRSINVVVAGRYAGNQVWAVVRVVPRFYDAHAAQFTVGNPLQDADILIVN